MFSAELPLLPARPSAMIVTAAAYAEIYAIIRASIQDDSFQQACRTHPALQGLDSDTLVSIYNQICVRVLKAESGARLNEANVNSIVQSVDSGAMSLQTLSTHYGLGSYKIAKTYVENVYGKAVQLSSVIESPCIIEDDRICLDVLNCVKNDGITSIESNLLKECIGVSYEELLIDLLTEYKLCFETEEQQRRRGKPKTPDILFTIPIAVRPAHCEEPLVINWIDSKAMFADRVTFMEHLEQFKGYTNRYGRGMVIYWHGFVDDVAAEAHASKDLLVVVVDAFPDLFFDCNPNLTSATADGNELSK